VLLKGYRYGFNGKEKDDDIQGTTGVDYDYGLRMYDARIGRFLSVDPLAHEFAWNSTYSFAENDVIRSIDVDGAEKEVRILTLGTKNKLEVSASSDIDKLAARALVTANQLPDDGIFQIFGLQNTVYGTYSFVDKGKAQTARFDINQLAAAYKVGEAESHALYVKNLGKTLHVFTTFVMLLHGAYESSFPANSVESEAEVSAESVAVEEAAMLKSIQNTSSEGLTNQAAEVSSSLDVEPLSNNALVVRGGIPSEAALIKGISNHPSGVTGFSVEAGELSVQELGSARPNAKVGVTTVGDIRAAGGDVIRTKGGSQNHATVTGISAEKASPLFKVETNPTPKKVN
jgi:RHS repeat-associated protein